MNINLSRRTFLLTATSTAGGLMLGIGTGLGDAKAATVVAQPWHDDDATAANEIDAWIAQHCAYYASQSTRNETRRALISDFRRDSALPIMSRKSAITLAARSIKAIREAEHAIERLNDGLDDKRTEEICHEIASVLKGEIS